MQSIPLILFIIVFNFLLVHLAPGDPALMFVTSDELVVDPEYLEIIRARLGLDQPLHVQLLTYMGKTVRGDLGTSFVYHRPVIEVIMEKAGPTLLLMGTGILFSTIFGIIFGVLASNRGKSTPTRVLSSLITNVSVMGYAIPVFWLGQMLILVFSIYLRWFPIGGIISLRDELTYVEKIMSILRHLVLPMVAVSLIQLAGTIRFTKASMTEALGQDYIVTARSKGASERTVYYKHALRNALFPVITMLGLRIGFLLSGAVITETIFSWPGVGRMTYEAILSRDYPLLMGVFFMISTLVVIAQLLTDIIYAILDPRIRYE